MALYRKFFSLISDSLGGVYIIQIIWFLSYFYLYLGAWYISSLYGQDSMDFLKEYDQNPIEATKALGGEFLTGIIS